MHEEYKEQSIELIKIYLKHILEILDRHDIGFVNAIHFEHLLYYEVYTPLLKIAGEESRYEEE